MSALIDTSAWFLLLLRQKQPTENHTTRILRSLIDANETLFASGIIVQEVLQGVRDEKHFAKLHAYFKSINSVEATDATYVDAARLHRRCRAKGLQVGTINSLIAAIAIEHNLPLLTADADFQRMLPLCELRLL